MSFARRIAKLTLLPLSSLEDSSLLLGSVASGTYRLVMDTFDIAWHRPLTALPGFYFANKKMKRYFLYNIKVEPFGLHSLSVLAITY